MKSIRYFFKRLAFYLSISMMIISFGFQTSAETALAETESFIESESTLTGDANCDGFVDILDIITIANYIMNLNPEPFCFENADFNNDGVINLTDLISTVNIITGFYSMPQVITANVGDITSGSAMSGGNVIDDGNDPVIARGVVWGTEEHPTLIDNAGFTLDGEGLGVFTSTMAGLEPETNYFIRAYATNNLGTAYGNEFNFTTLEGIPPGYAIDVEGNLYPIIVIGNLEWFGSNLITTKFSDNSNIPVDHFKIYDHTLIEGINSEEEMKELYGILYNYAVVSDPANACPTGWRVSTKDDWDNLASNLGPSAGAGNKLKSCRQVNSPLGGDCTTEIHPRWNSATQFGTDDFEFSAFPAGAFTTSFTNLGSQAWFWTENDPRIAARIWHFTNNIFFQTNANEANFYSIRCVRDGAAIINPPTITTRPVTNVTETTAISGGNVTNDGGAEVNTRGVVWSTSPDPTIENNVGITNDGDGLGHFISQLTNLVDQTTYFVRAYATNNEGTSYGNEFSFTAGVETGVVDVEGNAYATITIGSQTWMASNLRTKTFRDGTAIPLLSDTDWAAVDYTTNPASSYGVYPHTSIDGLNSEEEVMDAYGLVYNWFAATNASGLCPDGWHVPSNDEIDTLILNLSGGQDNGGKQLKSCRQVNAPAGGDCNTTEHPRWNSFSGIFGTDDYDFSALPAGYRTSTGSYAFVGAMTGFWTSTIVLANPPFGWVAPAFRMDQANDLIFREMWQPLLGYSVRCVKD